MSERVVPLTRSLGISPADIAEAHLAVRQNQEMTGTNQFSNIHDSQADLLDLENYYIARGGNFFVATTDQGKLCGFVGLRNDGKGNATLKRLAVLPDYEGRGIGKAVIGKLVWWAGQAGFQRISLQTGGDELARTRIYEKFGFQDVGRVPKSNKTDEYLMEVELRTK